MVVATNTKIINPTTTNSTTTTNINTPTTTMTMTITNTITTTTTTTYTTNSITTTTTTTTNTAITLTTSTSNSTVAYILKQSYQNLNFFGKHTLFYFGHILVIFCSNSMILDIFHQPRQRGFQKCPISLKLSRI